MEWGGIFRSRGSVAAFDVSEITADSAIFFKFYRRRGIEDQLQSLPLSGAMING